MIICPTGAVSLREKYVLRYTQKEEGRKRLRERERELTRIMAPCISTSSKVDFLIPVSREREERRALYF